MLPCYEYFFGNFIFALIARTFRGNHLRNVTASCYDDGKRDEKGTRIDHMTERKKCAKTLRSVAAFLFKQENLRFIKDGPL